jgi:3-methyladenine DNA glycosylase AlkD
MKNNSIGNIDTANQTDWDKLKAMPDAEIIHDADSPATTEADWEQAFVSNNGVKLKMNISVIEFNQETFNDFMQILYQKQDLKYKEFNDKVVNGVGESIGVRVPDLRNIAKQISKSENHLEMLKIIAQQNLYELRMIEGILIGLIKVDNNQLPAFIENFVEKRINNWALCDCFVSSLKDKVKHNKTWFYEKAKFYAVSENPWEIRFGLVIFLSYFKERDYFAQIQDIILNLTCQEYYVRMAAAWLISVLYVEMPIETLDLLKNNRLDNWTRNKAVQKIKESYRVSAEEKAEAENIKKLFSQKN